MKKSNFKKLVANTLSNVGMNSAKKSSSLCSAYIFHEPKMPNSLYKRD